MTYTPFCQMFNTLYHTSLPKNNNDRKLTFISIIEDSISETINNHSFFWLVKQQLSIDHFANLYSWYRLAYFQSSSCNIQFGFIHEIAYRKCRTYRLTIFTIEQNLTLVQKLFHFFIKHIEVNIDGNIFIKWPIMVTLMGILELSYLLFFSVIDEINQRRNPHISKLFLAVWRVDVSLNKNSFTK